MSLHLRLPRPSFQRLFTALLTAAVVGAGSARADEWVDVSGTHTLSADFLGIWGEKAIFALPDGRRRAVELKNLQAESRLRALDLAEQRKAHLEDFKAELQARAEAERAPGPADIPPPAVAAPEYQPLPAGASLEATVSHTLDQLRAGHLRVLWDGLPPSYQQDVQALVLEFAGKTDAESWNRQLAAFQRLTTLLAGREEWIFTHPLIAALVANDEMAARSSYRALVGLMQTLADPEKLSLDRLQQGKLGELIAELDQEMAGYLYHFNPQIHPLLPTNPEVQMVDETHGVVTVTPPGASPLESAPAEGSAAGYPQAGASPPGYPQAGASPPGYTQPGAMMGNAGASGALPPTKMVLVEGRWISEALANTWKENLERARQRLDTLPADLEAYRQAIDLYLSPLESAGSREAFHAGMDPLIADLSVTLLRTLGTAGGERNPSATPYGTPSTDYMQQPGATPQYDTPQYDTPQYDTQGSEDIQSPEYMQTR